MFPLPEDCKAILSRLEGVKELKVISELDGKSGARIYKVDVTPITAGGPEGSCVVKVDVTERAREERQNHAKAKSSVLGRYVPELASSILGEKDADLSAVLYTVATGSLLYSRPLKWCIQEHTQRSAAIVAEITKVFLNEWNAECECKVTDVCQVLKDGLGPRLHGADSVQSRIGSFFDVGKHRIEGEPLENQWLVNPLPYVLQNLQIPGGLGCTIPFGKLHGDLHTTNIIVSELPESARGTQPAFNIIDFALYRQGNVLLDLAYLEIAIILQLFNGFQTPFDRKTWWNLEQYLTRNLVPPQTFDGVGHANDAVALLLPTRKIVQQRAQRENRYDDYWIAYLLASVEAALNWARKLTDEPCLERITFLTAASRFHRILQEFERSHNRSLIEPKKTQSIGQIDWPTAGLELKQPTTTVEGAATLDQLALDLASPLRDRQCVLILGDQFAKEVFGIPFDGTLMREIAKELNVDSPPGGGETNIGALDRLSVENASKQQAVADCLNKMPVPQLADRSINLALINWLAIMDWSFSPALAKRLETKLLAGQQLRRVFFDEAENVDFHTPGFVPFIHLRGTTDEFGRLALGVRGLRQQHDKRQALLKSLFRALPVKPVILAIGFDRGTFDYIKTDITEAVGPEADVWVIRASFSEEDRTMLEESWQFTTRDLSPSQFLDLCAYVGLPSLSEPQPLTGEYVLKLSGVERVERDSGLPYFRRSRSADETRREQVPITTEDFRKIDRHLEVLHQGSLAMENESRRAVGDFYLGQIVLWKELALNLALWRRRPGDGMMQTITADLKDSEPRRVSLWYQPGAGATTLLRQLGFKLYFEHGVPVALLRRCTRDTYGEVIRFYNYFRRSFVLLVDEQDVSRGDADTLFGKLQERRAPVVLIYAARSGQSKGELEKDSEKPVEGRQGRFAFADVLNPDERQELSKRLRTYTDEGQLRRFLDSKQESLFLSMLETFEDKFTKVEDVVGGMLGLVDNNIARELIVNICFLYHYGHRSTPTSILQRISDLSSEEIGARLEPFEERLLRSWYFENQKEWAPRHDLLAEAVLALTIGSSRPSGTPLKEYTINLINRLAKDMEAGDLARDIVWALVGTDREQAMSEEMHIGPQGVRTMPSRLMRDISVISAQEEVWKTVVQSYPDSPLFRAHYGRFLYGRDVKRYDAADEQLKRAEELSESKDHTILHMLGMRYRSELMDELRKRRQAYNQVPADLNERITFLVEQASNQFEKAIAIQPQDEYGYVSYIQMLCGLVQDIVSRMEGDIRRRTILTREDVQQWLRKAHELVKEAEIYIPRENRTDYLRDARSHMYEVEGSADQVIADYRSALVSLKPPRRDLVREQLARRLYDRGFRHKIQSAAQKVWQADFEEATRLMGEAVREDPYDSFRISLWFRSARFCPAISRQELIQRLEDLWREAKTLEAAFYLSCLYFLEGLEYNNKSDFERSETFRAESEARSASGLARRAIREWVGQSYTLIPSDWIASFLEQKTGEDPREWFNGPIISVASEVDGRISLQPVGWPIWFPPSLPGHHYYTTADVRQITLKFMIGFSYDRPRAWFPKPFELKVVIPQ